MGRIALTVGLGLAAACTFGSADSKRASTTDPGGDGGTTSATDTGNALTGLPLDTGDGTTAAVSPTGSGSDGTGSTGPEGNTTSTSGDSTSGDSTSGDSTSGGDPFVLCDEEDLDLRACYDFASLRGGVLTDHSTYENHGTATLVDVEPGPFMGAVRLSDDAQIAVPDSPSLDLAGPMSLEAWVYIDSLPDEDRVGLVDNDGQYSAMLYADDGIRCHGGNAQASSSAFPVGDWFHVACVHDGEGIEIWIDGQLQASGEGTDPIATGSAIPVAVGDSSPDYEVPLDGLVGAVRIWSLVRTPEELKAAANTGR